MDEVLDQLNKTSFIDLYKQKSDNQEQRRKDLLNAQKSLRNNLVDTCRGILGLVDAVDNNDFFQEKKVLYKPKIFVAGFTQCAYSNVLMLSEWMVEKPEDFHENWYVVPCPKGIRTLVVANRGTTKLFSKYGQFRGEYKTALPGGHSGGLKNRCCILDCFQPENSNIMYVLDLLAWNTQPMTDGETEFRHYWMESNFREIPELERITKKNKLIFKILPKVLCTRENFNEFMMKVPHFPDFNPRLDGLLFYHKLAHYYSGETPLVGWMYPYMVPEVFGEDITINPVYLEKPPNYVNQAEFIARFNETYRKRAKKARNSEQAMETTPSSPLSENNDNKTTESQPMDQLVPSEKFATESESSME
ncbi:hypothetical protein HW555_002561 [Spodoptera exigua]|uniref:Snurportin-1 n=1 Tax=Spodoptera exigua TaxID=7107 RepID=A0A835GM48_SPOEX|nr:hypothetical protein HW555_002561 [Spodoptera exigua]